MYKEMYITRSYCIYHTFVHKWTHLQADRAWLFNVCGQCLPSTHMYSTRDDWRFPQQGVMIQHYFKIYMIYVQCLQILFLGAFSNFCEYISRASFREVFETCIHINILPS